MVSGPVDALKPRIAAAVDRLADELEALSHRIHDHPELAFKEEQAHAWLTEFLAKHGARVERAVGGLSTAFRATIDGAGPGPTIAIMAEYDALPGIGHACGHNVIATAGTGAGVALAVALGTLPFPGRVQVIGDRKSTRLNSSHGYISYAVFCLKKKKKRSRLATYTKH